jgi:hypothetical protein
MIRARYVCDEKGRHVFMVNATRTCSHNDWSFDVALVGTGFQVSPVSHSVEGKLACRILLVSLELTCDRHREQQRALCRTGAALVGQQGVSILLKRIIVEFGLHTSFLVQYIVVVSRHRIMKRCCLWRLSPFLPRHFREECLIYVRLSRDSRQAPTHLFSAFCACIAGL